MALPKNSQQNLLRDDPVVQYAPAPSVQYAPDDPRGFNTDMSHPKFDTRDEIRMTPEQRGLRKWAPGLAPWEIETDPAFGSSNIAGFRTSDDANLSGLFSNLNRVSMQNRIGSTGGGSEEVEGNMDANDLIAYNQYMGRNVTSFNQGGDYDFTGQKRADRQRAEREAQNEWFYDNMDVSWSGGSSDTPYNRAYQRELEKRQKESYLDKLSRGEFHGPQTNIDLKNPWEEGYDDWFTDYNQPLTSNAPTSGRINRGVLSRGTYNRGGAYNLYNKGGSYNPYGVPQYRLGGFLKKVFGGASKAFKKIADPIADLLDPMFDTAGDVLDPALNLAGDIGSTAGKITTDIADTAITGGLKGIRDVGHEVLIPLGEGILSPVGHVLEGVVDLFSGGSPDSLAARNAQEKLNRDPASKVDPGVSPSGLKVNKGGLTNIKKDSQKGFKPDGDWVGEKENPYVTPNVDEELDYAAKGMKFKYNHGGSHPEENPKTDSIPFGRPQGLYDDSAPSDSSPIGLLSEAIGTQLNSAKTYMTDEFPMDLYHSIKQLEKSTKGRYPGDVLMKQLEKNWLSTRDAVSGGAKAVWNKNMEVKKGVEDALKNAYQSGKDYLGFDNGGVVGSGEIMQPNLDMSAAAALKDVLANYGGGSSLLQIPDHDMMMRSIESKIPTENIRVAHPLEKNLIDVRSKREDRGDDGLAWDRLNHRFPEYENMELKNLSREDLIQKNMMFDDLTSHTTQYNDFREQIMELKSKGLEVPKELIRDHNKVEKKITQLELDIIDFEKKGGKKQAVDKRKTKKKDEKPPFEWFEKGGSWGVNGKDYQRTNKKDNGEILKLMKKHGLKEDHSESDEQRMAFWKEAVEKGYYTKKNNFDKGGSWKNYKAQKMKKGGKFKPHMMYDPKTGKGYMANKLQDHLDFKKKGYDHRKRNPENYPKAKQGMKRSYTNGGKF